MLHLVSIGLFSFITGNQVTGCKKFSSCGKVPEEDLVLFFVFRNLSLSSRRILVFFCGGVTDLFSLDCRADSFYLVFIVPGVRRDPGIGFPIPVYRSSLLKKYKRKVTAGTGTNWSGNLQEEAFLCFLSSLVFYLSREMLFLPCPTVPSFQSFPEPTVGHGISRSWDVHKESIFCLPGSVPIFFSFQEERF